MIACGWWRCADAGRRLWRETRVDEGRRSLANGKQLDAFVDIIQLLNIFYRL